GGQSDIGGLGLLAGAWQQPSGKVWFDGDFTYDGAVDIGDLGLLAGNWQKGTAGGSHPATDGFQRGPGAVLGLRGRCCAGADVGCAGHCRNWIACGSSSP